MFYRRGWWWRCYGGCRWRVSSQFSSYLLGWQRARVQLPIPSPTETTTQSGCFHIFWLQYTKERCWISFWGTVKRLHLKIRLLKINPVVGFYRLSTSLSRIFVINILLDSWGKPARKPRAYGRQQKSVQKRHFTPWGSVSFLTISVLSTHS